MPLVRDTLPLQAFYETAHMDVFCCGVGPGFRHFRCVLSAKHLRGDRERVLLAFHHFPEPKCKRDEVRITLKINNVSYSDVPLKILDVTWYVLAAVNVIHVEGPNVPPGLRVSMHVVKKPAALDLLRSAVAFRLKVDNFAAMQRLLKNALEDGNSQEAAVSSITVSLVCPLMKTRIRVPCRGSRCWHVETFDGTGYLKLNESTLRPQWRCPVCHRSASVDKLRIDLFTVDVLERVPSTCVAVNIFAGGRWEPVVERALDVIDLPA